MTQALRSTQSGARIDSPTRARIEILDVACYALFLLNAASSAWGRKASTIYRSDFGFGLVEWRVIAMLEYRARDYGIAPQDLDVFLRVMRQVLTNTDPRPKSCFPLGCNALKACMCVVVQFNPIERDMHWSHSSLSGIV